MKLHTKIKNKKKYSYKNNKEKEKNMAKNSQKPFIHLLTVNAIVFHVCAHIQFEGFVKDDRQRRDPTQSSINIVRCMLCVCAIEVKYL